MAAKERDSIFDVSRVVLTGPLDVLVPRQGWVTRFFVLRQRTLGRWRSEASYKQGTGRRPPVFLWDVNVPLELADLKAPDIDEATVRPVFFFELRRPVDGALMTFRVKTTQDLAVWCAALRQVLPDRTRDTPPSREEPLPVDFFADDVESETRRSVASLSLGLRGGSKSMEGSSKSRTAASQFALRPRKWRAVPAKISPSKVAVRTRQILGLWKVASFAIFTEGMDIIYPWKQGPFFVEGMLVYFGDGQMESEMTRLGRGESGGTEEVKAAYSGRFEVTGKGSHVHHYMHASPNDARWVGQVETRQIYFRGQLLTLAAPVTLASGETALAVTSYRRMLARELQQSRFA